MKIIDTIWNFILKFFRSTEQSIVAGFKAGIDNVIAEIGSDGWKVVTDAVAAAEAAGGTGPDKRNAAFLKIIEDLKTMGKEVALNTINLAIEAAVAKFRDDMNAKN